MIIGIGGVSRAGKTSYAERLKKIFTKKRVIILSQDDFVFPENQIPKIKDRTDWECPESIDFDKFYETITISSRGHDIVIVEGLLIFYQSRITDLFDITYFLEIDKDTFMKRKSDDTRWGKEPDWYLEHIWNSYLKFGRVGIPEQTVFIKSDESILKSM
jgi:uridine kinase